MRHEPGLHEGPVCGINLEVEGSGKRLSSAVRGGRTTSGSLAQARASEVGGEATRVSTAETADGATLDQQVPARPARDLPARPAPVGADGQPGRRRRAPAGPELGRLPRALARAGLSAREHHRRRRAPRARPASSRPDGSKTSRTYALTSESANSCRARVPKVVAQVVEAQVLDVGGPKRGGRPSCTTDRSADAARTLSSSAMRRGRCPTRSSPRLACAGRGCGVRPAARRQADRSSAWTLAASHDIPRLRRREGRLSQAGPVADVSCRNSCHSFMLRIV
jgi:hypothetical protein